MYRTYKFQTTDIAKNLIAAIRDWIDVKRQPSPAGIIVNPVHLAQAGQLTTIKVSPCGGCLSNEVWIEPV